MNHRFNHFHRCVPLNACACIERLLSLAYCIKRTMLKSLNLQKLTSTLKFIDPYGYQKSCSDGESDWGFF